MLHAIILTYTPAHACTPGQLTWILSANSKARRLDLKGGGGEARGMNYGVNGGRGGKGEYDRKKKKNERKRERGRKKEKPKREKLGGAWERKRKKTLK